MTLKIADTNGRSQQGQTESPTTILVNKFDMVDMMFMVNFSGKAVNSVHIKNDGDARDMVKMMQMLQTW